MLSHRSSFELSPNRLATALAAARAAGRPVIDLTESNPTRAGVPYDAPAILGALATPSSLVYEPEPLGSAAARAEVSAELARGGTVVDPARIVLTASTSEAYAHLFKLLCDPGDEVLVPRPSYPLFEHLARLESVRAVPYSLAYDGAWHLDTAAVAAAVSPKTRAILTVSPNNPTGSFLKRDELRALAGFGLPLVSDEVFAGYPLRDDVMRAGSALEAQSTEAPLVFALGGLSKAAALPQMKLAWVAVGGHEPAVAGALGRLEVIADAFLSVGTPVQRALPSLLAAGRDTASAIHARVRANLAWLAGACRGAPLTLLDVEGGWYATLHLPSTRTEEDWAVGLVERAGIYVHPGHFFDFDREPFVVVSLLTPEPAFVQGITQLVDHVAREA
jgi:aspartate/methionine/tyrosine aminotransferase